MGPVRDHSPSSSRRHPSPVVLLSAKERTNAKRTVSSHIDQSTWHIHSHALAPSSSLDDIRPISISQLLQKHRAQVGSNQPSSSSTNKPQGTRLAEKQQSSQKHGRILIAEPVVSQNRIRVTAGKTSSGAPSSSKGYPTTQTPFRPQEPNLPSSEERKRPVIDPVPTTDPLLDESPSPSPIAPEPTSSAAEASPSPTRTIEQIPPTPAAASPSPSTSAPPKPNHRVCYVPVGFRNLISITTSLRNTRAQLSFYRDAKGDIERAFHAKNERITWGKLKKALAVTFNALPSRRRVKYQEQGAYEVLLCKTMGYPLGHPNPPVVNEDGSLSLGGGPPFPYEDPVCFWDPLWHGLWHGGVDQCTPFIETTDAPSDDELTFSKSFWELVPRRRWGDDSVPSRLVQATS
ncbi:hypothetical protein D9611_012678 [Ephemerocybe angulata]|uniref:Uncharacterized protein n=1 Tax=Ephemerocybe angulata TaxID=980116 RepID=A0A8H5F0I7_9AGAR|nr:hypothetical protein D9611_012678 [Tulosesus angulatus]